ncbi:MAG: hypothetical protein GY827_02175 [Cytophagales bacterium]|nr:hypothetical protein [Cytophagales bacterium]
MKLPSFFKTPRHRQFEYQPRYYDEVKEDIEKRTQRIKAELNKDLDSDEVRVSQIRGSFQNARQETETRKIPFIFVLIILLSSATFGYIYTGNITVFYVSVGLGVVLSLYKQKLKIFK